MYALPIDSTFTLALEGSSEGGRDIPAMEVYLEGVLPLEPKRLTL
jgi:hypothetical protein